MSLFLELDALAHVDRCVRHGFFGRRGGNSTGVYASLNCGLATNDPHAADNRAVVARAVGGDPAHLQTVYQVHGAECVVVEKPLDVATRPRADALVTSVPGLILGVLTADCGPVLFCGKRADGSPVIAAAHAGWKGALGGILESTVTKMCDLGAELPSIHAGLGPCIGKRSYEVSLGFEQPFLTRDPSDEIFFMPKPIHCRPGSAQHYPGSSSVDDQKIPARATLGRDDAGVDKLLFDLPGYIAKRLAACGVRRVTLADVDTVTNDQEYFSYRRATLQGGGDNGRQISVITIGQ